MRGISVFLIAFLIGTLAHAQERFGQHGGGGYHGYRDNGWHGGNRYGYDFGGAIIGGAIGGIFGSWFAPRPEVIVVPQEMIPYSPMWYQYCANKYRSFDPPTGSYLGFDGLRHNCL
jgi:hypothetical protein